MQHLLPLPRRGAVPLERGEKPLDVGTSEAGHADAPHVRPNVVADEPFVEGQGHLPQSRFRCIREPPIEKITEPRAHHVAEGSVEETPARAPQLLLDLSSSGRVEGPPPLPTLRIGPDRECGNPSAIPPFEDRALPCPASLHLFALPFFAAARFRTRARASFSSRHRFRAAALRQAGPQKRARLCRAFKPWVTLQKDEEKKKGLPQWSSNACSSGCTDLWS